MVVTCIATSAFSQVGVSIAGPDIIVALFNADMVRVGATVRVGLGLRLGLSLAIGL